MPRSQQDKDFLTSLAYENLAVTLSKMKRNDLFFFYLSKNKELLEKQNINNVYTSLISLYAMLGTYYTDNKKYDIANSNFQKSVDISKKYKFPYISFTYRKWGDLKQSQMKPDSAIKLYEKSIDILKETNFKSEIPVVYHQMEKAYNSLGDKQLAKEYKLKALELQNQVKTEQLKSSSAAVEEILKEEKKKITSENFRHFRIFIICSIVLMILVIIGIINYYRGKKYRILRENEEILLKKEKEIKLLSDKVTGSLKDLIHLAKSNNPSFFIKFQEMYPDFSKKLLAENSSLTKTELIFCAYIYLGFSTKDVAEFTYRTPKSIENIRYYVRKKLNFSSNIDFTIGLIKILGEK